MPEKYEKQNTSFRDSVDINGTHVPYEIVSSEVESEDLLKITVANLDDPDEVKRMISEAVQREYWFLSESIKSETLRERYRITFDIHHKVEIYNFGGEDLPKSELDRLADGLMKLFAALKDKTVWTLESVQIKSQDVYNSKSGEHKRGLEVPEQHRFELYPASFAEGKYRGNIQTSWLEGATLHEVTHICLEQALAPVWHEHAKELGWEYVEDVLIELPGGILTRNFNAEPQRCASEYATYQPDDDRAESVVQWIVDPNTLDPVRARLLETVLDEKASEDKSPIVEKVETVMPSHIPVLKVQVQSLFSAFKASGRRTAGLRQSVMTLGEYRAKREIAKR